MDIQKEFQILFEFFFFKSLEMIINNEIAYGGTIVTFSYIIPIRNPIRNRCCINYANRTIIQYSLYSNNLFSIYHQKKNLNFLR